MLPTLQRAANISYRESGRREAPALVLLHGIGSTSSGWRLQYAPLGERFRVLAWDAPGYGESAPLAGEAPGVDAYVAALVRWLDALGIERALVASNSWGTVSAVGLAHRHPARVLGLVLGGPAIGMARLGAEERAKAIAARVERMQRLGPEKMRDEDATRLVAPGASPEVLAWIRNPAGLTVEGYCQAARMLGAADVLGELAGLRCPVTVVSGERDVVTPPEAHAKRIAAALPHARFESVPGCGHLPHLERAERFDAAVLETARAARLA